MITLDNFIGNTDLIRLLKVSVQAAQANNTALPHVLLKGPAGTGKTTLAEALARAFGAEPMALTPETAKKTNELHKLFLRMPDDGYDENWNIKGKIRPSIVFCDEIHQLSLVAQENLGIAMQDWRLPVRVNGIDYFDEVPRFTLVGATTLAGKLSKPFLDRFKIQSEFEIYSLEESIKIAHVQAASLDMQIEPRVAEVVARRSRGVARLVVRFLERIRDAYIVEKEENPFHNDIITAELAENVFQQFLKIDRQGLTKTDIKILAQLSKLSEPTGLDTLCVIANEDKGTVENVIEPYLIQQGFIVRTKRGRLLTEEGRQYLNSAGYVSSKSGSRSFRRITQVA